MVYNIANAGFLLYEHFDDFVIDKYKFVSLIDSRENVSGVEVIGANRLRDFNRKSRVSAKVLFTGCQKNSVLFIGGRRGRDQLHSRMRKYIEDVLLLISLLTGRAWILSSDRHHAVGGLIPTLSLKGCPSFEPSILKADVEGILTVIGDVQWQEKYLNGFHLRALYNHMSVTNIESRFLQHITLWEWLYARINGIESDKLYEIIRFLLKYFFSTEYNDVAFLNRADNVAYCLRNQLAHNGMLPVDRPYASDWVKDIKFETEVTRNRVVYGLRDYFSFFDHLTYTLVFKTVDLDLTSRFDTFGFSQKLSNYLRSGRIS